MISGLPPLESVAGSENGAGFCNVLIRGLESRIYAIPGPPEGGTPNEIGHHPGFRRIDAAAALLYSPRMAKKTDGQPASPARGVHAASTSAAQRAVKRDESRAPQAATRPSALLDTRVVYCGDNLEPPGRMQKEAGRMMKPARFQILHSAFCLCHITTATVTPATASRSCSTRFSGRIILTTEHCQKTGKKRKIK
jgi:hypothetical protein